MDVIQTLYPLAVKEDRISDLPDSILHHILSLLPSTREAIRTTLLTKRWHNQWTRVPVLIFDSQLMPSDQSDKYLLRLIDNALHHYDCSYIKKLHFAYDFQQDPDFASKLRFATRKHVEELILNCYSNDCYMLPKFLIDNSSLVELEMYNCSVFAYWSINWISLKKLDITGPRSPSIGKLVSGCPMLECLELKNWDEREVNEDNEVIASKTLKRLILSEIKIGNSTKISCPNLVELAIMRDLISGLPDKMVEISCPNLKSVKCVGSNFKLVNCPSLVYADLDFEIDTEIEGDGENVAKRNLEHLQNVEKLMVRSWFIKVLSALEMKRLSYPMLYVKMLTLRATNFEHLPGIICALRSSPLLEQLIINLPICMDRMAAAHSELNDSGENYCNSIGTDFNCLVSHLKYVEIDGLFKLHANANFVNFIEFLLNNARVLETLVVVISHGRTTTDFAYKVSQKVLSFPRCSPHAIVLLY